MTTDDLYRLVDQLLPPLAVAVLAVLALVSCIAHAVLKRRPRALALAIGAGNMAGVYLWTHLAGLSVTARAGGIRVAIAVMLLSILIYNESAWPYLSDALRRGARYLWSKRRWRK